MRALYFLSLFLLSAMTWAAAKEWRVVAESIKCKVKYQVLAKDGEKHVFIMKNGEKISLSSIDGAPYSDESSKPQIFSNLQDETLSADEPRYSYTRPAVFDGNPPKIDIVMNGEKLNCKMLLK